MTLFLSLYAGGWEIYNTFSQSRCAHLRFEKVLYISHPPQVKPCTKALDAVGLIYLFSVRAMQVPIAFKYGWLTYLFFEAPKP